MKNQGNAVLEIENLSVTFTQYERGMGLRQRALRVISDLSLRIRPGEMAAIVGASGSGKSLLAHAVLGILPVNAAAGGRIYYNGELLTESRLRAARGHEIVLVPQSVSYLDPLMRVGEQIRNGGRSREIRENSRNILKRYGLSEDTEALYPFELSGGMTRRVLISTAVMENPKLVIADEPTPGLHIEAAKRVLGHFREIAEQGAGVMLITHDLELALTVADRVAVFYAGTVVEEAKAGDFESESLLRHPYTKALYRAMPQNGFEAVPGVQPYAGETREGCPYAPRCSLAGKSCGGEIAWRELRGGWVRCPSAV